MKYLLISLIMISGLFASGLEFLNHEVGARENSMGGIGILSERSVFSAFYNPALLTTDKNMRLGAGNAFWFNGINNYYGSFQFPWGKWHVGLSAYLSSADDIEVRSVPSETPVGTTNWTDWYIGLTIAGKITDKVTLGFRAKRVVERILENSAGGYAFDAGALLELSPQINMGVSMKNMGNMSALNQTPSPMPLLFQTSMAVNKIVQKQNFVFNAAMAYQYFSRDDLTQNYLRFGSELSLKKRFFVRTGLIFGNDLSKYTFGLGFRQGVWNINYALRPTQYGLDDIHVFSFSLAL